MMSAKGSLLFFSSECVVGTAFNVDRTYLGAQFASGEGVTLVYNEQLTMTVKKSSTPGFSHWAGERWAAAAGPARQH